MSAAIALSLIALLLSAPLPFYLTGLPWPTAVVASIVAGVLLGAFGSFLVDWIPLPPLATAAVWTALCWAGFLALRKSAPLTERFRVRPESLAGRFAGFSMLALLGMLLLVYLWANLVHPPILAETLFKWSGPARGLGPVFGLPLRFSAYYYALAHTDVGWKFLWSVLSLLPLFVTGAALYAQSRGISAVAGSMLGGALSFSFLFWGSTGQPDLFLAGVITLLWWSALTPWAARAWVFWPATLVLVWSGAFWGALAVPALLASASRKDAIPAFRATEAIAATFLLVRWAWGLSPDWRLWNDIVVYFARDAWNIARYGPLTYLAFAFFLRTVRVGRSAAVTAGMAVSTLSLFVIELSSRAAPSQAVLIHVAGNRLFTCVLLITWFVVLYEGGRDIRVNSLDDNNPRAAV